MTIQPSILIWTIICFCLLMLILNKLLFKPMLSVMDARQEKIAKAREKKDSYAVAYAQAEKDLEAQQRNQEKSWAEEAAGAAAEAKAKADDLLAQAQQKQNAELSAFRKNLEAESAELKTKLDAGVDALASTFADRLVS